MRNDPALFQSFSSLPFQKPVFVVEISFDFANTDIHYFTLGNDVDTPTPANTIQGVISKISGTSQKLDLVNFNTTIGNINFSAVDAGKAITDLLRAKNITEQSLRNRRVQIKKGFEGFAYDDFVLVQTQIINNISFDGGTYNFKCYDVQRFAKKTIFDVKTATLTSDIVHADQTTAIDIVVDDTSGFEMVQHGASYSDATNLEVGYLYIEDGDNWTIYRYNSLNADGVTFEGCVPALGSVGYNYAATEGDGVDEKSRDIEVKELVYLELPAIKCAYALLTGNLYNQAGDRLPDHWHAGIDAAHISTNEFTGIGPDLWDIDDDTAGPIVRFIGVESVQAKSFIQKEIYALANVFSPVLANGELGLRRLSPIISTSPYNIILDEQSIAKASANTYAMDEVRNKIRMDWAWDFKREDYRRTNVLYDQSGIDKFGDHEEHVVQFKGLQPKIHAIDILNSHFSGYYDRFGDQPQRINIDLLPNLTHIEVGDLVRVNLSHLEDFADDGTLNRTFEVQSVKTDWIKGGVSLELFGSGRKPNPTAGHGYTPQSGNAVADEWYEQNGTKLSSVNYAEISNVGEDATLDTDLTLTGHDLLMQTGVGYRAACVYYVLGDFTIPFGVTLTINKNVFLKVMGTLTINGDIDGRGRGHAGGDNRRFFVDHSPFIGLNGSELETQVSWSSIANNTYPEPGRGLVSVALKGQPAISPSHYYTWTSIFQVDTRFTIFPHIEQNTYRDTLSSIPSNPMMRLDVSHSDPTYMYGIWGDLQGGGGYPGGAIYRRDNTPYKHGGDGGNGGAGLVILCRGMVFGSNGRIDLSGHDSGSADDPLKADPEKLDGTAAEWDELGFTGYQANTPSPELCAGAGAGGGPGCLYIFLDGAGLLAPTIDGSTVRQEYGQSLHRGSPAILPSVALTTTDYLVPNVWNDASNYTGTEVCIASPYLGVDQNNERDGYSAYTALKQLTPPSDPVDDNLNTREAADATFTLSETIGRGDGGRFSAIEVTVAPPTDTNWSHAEVRYRRSIAEAWTYAPPAEPESVFTVPSNGDIYTVQILSVSKGGVTSVFGPRDSIQTYDFDANPVTAHPPTQVTGLRISGELAAETHWNTKHLKVSCDVNNTMGVPFVFDDWISHLEFTFKNGNDTIRTVEHLSPFAELTFEQNNLNGVRANVITVEVVQVTIDGERSAVTSRVFTNPSPSAPTGMAETPATYGAQISWINPVVDDYQRTLLYVSETSGFTPGTTNLIWTGEASIAQLAELKPNTQYYYRLISVDWFGSQSAATAQRSFTTLDDADTSGTVGGLVDAVSRLGASGINVVVQPFSDFEDATLPSMASAAAVTVTLEETIAYFGNNSLKSVATAADGWMYLADSSSNYNTPIKPNTKWIFSAWVRCDKASKPIQVYMRTANAGVWTATDQTLTTGATVDVFTRVHGLIDLSNDTSTECNIRIDNDGYDGTNTTMYFDGIMLEEYKGTEANPDPSTYVRPSENFSDSAVYQSLTAAIGQKADTTYVDDQVSNAEDYADGAVESVNLGRYNGTSPPNDGGLRHIAFQVNNHTGNGYYWYKIAEFELVTNYDNASLFGTIAFGASSRFQKTQDINLRATTGGTVNLVSHAYEIQRDSSYAQLRAFVEDNGTTDQTMVVYAYLSSHTGFQGLLGVYITSPSAVTLWQTGLYVGDLNYTPPGTEINPVFNRGVADNATRNLVFRQASQPTGQNAGDLWFDTDDKNRLYYYSGSAWQDSRDTDIAAAISAAGTAQATADGKIDSFFQTSAPVSGMSTGDLWFDTDDKNKLYRYSGSAWVAARDADIGNAIQAASDAQSTADGKVTTFYAASAPTAEGNGDLWFNTNTGELRRWNLSSWIVVATANSIFRQSATPTGTLGAIWYNTTTSLLYRHNGTAWELIGNNYTLTSQLTDDAGLGDDTDWFSLGSMPDRFNETTTAGLNFTDQVLGYHNGTAMVSYITSDGHFYFSMDGNNYIAWNGTNFEIKAGNVRLGSNGNATFTGDISASAISGTTITGSTITGGTITGGEFRTDTSPNTRMVLNRGGSTGAGDGNNQLEFYLNDGSGEEKLVSIGTDAGIIQDHGLINVGSPEWELFGVFAVNNHYTNSTVAAVNSGGGAAIYGMSSATGFVWEKSVGVYGIGPTAGVCGDAQSEPQNACGVIGICTTTAYTSGDFPAGVKGTATLTWQYGVYGENAAFVGVGGTGITGVYGSSPAAGGKGLHGSATGTGAVGVMAESGNGDGCQASGAAGYYDFRATGAGTNGPFTGAHDGLMIDPDFEPGDIICVTGIVSSRGINDWIGSMVVADQDNMINAFGIITFSRDLPDYPAEGENDNRPNALTPLTETEYNDVKSTYKYVQANGVGEGMINVCSDGGDIEAGDWICTSTVRGKGKVYHGADSRAIVAKAAEAVIWANEPETTKLIACKYKTD